MQEPTVIHLADISRADRTVIDALPHPLVVLDGRGRVTEANARWIASGPDDPHVLQAREGDDLLSLLAAAPPREHAVAEHLLDGLHRVLDGRVPTFELQYALTGPDGSCWYLVAAGAAEGGGLVLTHADTTVHHTVNDVLTEMAFHDPLTGLPNRALVTDRIRLALIRSQRTDSFPAVMFVDLDGFKSVNDRYGHEVGDAVLGEAGRRLSNAVREGDTCGRWGGDEFVVVVELSRSGTVDGLVRRARRAFAQPFRVDGRRIDIGLSIGVVLASRADRVDQLVRRADEAMYQAKRSGAGVVVLDQAAGG